MPCDLKTEWQRCGLREYTYHARLLLFENPNVRRQWRPGRPCATKSRCDKSSNPAPAMLCHRATNAPGAPVSSQGGRKLWRVSPPHNRTRKHQNHKTSRNPATTNFCDTYRRQVWGCVFSHLEESRKERV